MNIFNRFRLLLGMATAATFAVALPAQAGIFLEPGVTYQGISDATITYPAPGSSTAGDLKGFGLMGRVGGKFADILFLAADGRWSNLSLHNNLVNSSGSSFNYGLTLGAQMPVAGLRGWAGWIIGGETDPGASSGFDAKYKSGTGWRLGAGLYLMFVSVNVEYQQITYDEIEVQSLGSFPVGTNFGGVELKDHAWVFSLSFPLEAG